MGGRIVPSHNDRIQIAGFLRRTKGQRNARRGRLGRRISALDKSQGSGCWGRGRRGQSETATQEQCAQSSEEGRFREQFRSKREEKEGLHVSITTIFTIIA